MVSSVLSLTSLVGLPCHHYIVEPHSRIAGMYVQV
jgi:hypothetical protein